MVFNLLGAADRNTQRRRAEAKDYKQAKEQWRITEKLREDEHKFNEEQYEAEIQHYEDNLRFTEGNILHDHDYLVERQDYEFDLATRAFERSEQQSESQLRFNAMAEVHAYAQQDAKNRDDLLASIFDESDSLLNYISGTAGLKLAKDKGVTDANFQRSRIDSKFAGDIMGQQIKRRETQAKSTIETQQAIVEGMKLAGQISAKAGSGRSAAKAVLGALAESGARRAAIANSLMYAEQDIDLGIAQLKDMLILDQTMSLAAKHYAENDFSIKSATLDTTRDLDKLKIDATKKSNEQRDRIVRESIALQRKQADLRAEASVLMEPERLPAPVDPRIRYAEYDDPDTEDYVEMLIRKDFADFPKFRPTEEPDREDFRGTRGRENVALSNFGDLLKIGGLAVSTVAGIGGIGAMTTGGGALFNMTAGQSALYGGIGTSLSNLGSSFYPQQ